jgi:glycosyltransferase involved in cell wall biosynthesis
MLRQDGCRGLIAWNEKGKQNVVNAYGFPGLEDMISVLPLSMRIPKNHEPVLHEGFNALFLGTSNLHGDWNFYYRGGNRMLRVFKRFSSGKPDARLIITGEIPHSERWRLEGMQVETPGLLERNELDDALRKADVLFYPSYTTPGLAFLEAMRFHVPILTTNAFANEEIVDGKNGIACRFADFKKADGPYGSLPLTGDYIQYEKGSADAELEDSLLEALERLYSDRGMARKMGDSGFNDISSGRLCLQVRNRKLLEVYESALS